MSYSEEGSPPLLRLLQEYRAGALAYEKEGGAWALHVFEVLVFHYPWNPGDLVMWGNQIPMLREDAGQCTSLFDIICSGCDPSWANAGLLLKELFHPQEQEKTIEKKHVELTYWQEEVGLSGLRLILIGIVIIRER